MPGPDGDAGLREGLHHLVLVELAQVDPGEVGLRLRGLESQLAELLLDEDPLDHVLLNAVGDVVLVADRLA